MTESNPDNGSDPQGGNGGNDPQNGTGEQDLSPEAMRAELKRARDEAARYRQRAREFADDETYKRAKDAVAALDKVEQDKKTEVQRLTEDKEGLLHRASSAETDLMRLRVALGAGIPSDQADEFASRLRGDSEEDLKKDAADLAKFFGSSSSSSSTSTRRSDPSQGAGGDSSPPEDPIQAALIEKLGIPH